MCFRQPTKWDYIGSDQEVEKLCISSANEPWTNLVRCEDASSNCTAEKRVLDDTGISLSLLVLSDDQNDIHYFEQIGSCSSFTLRTRKICQSVQNVSTKRLDLVMSKKLSAPLLWKLTSSDSQRHMTYSPQRKGGLPYPVAKLIMEYSFIWGVKVYLRIIAFSLIVAFLSYVTCFAWSVMSSNESDVRIHLQYTMYPTRHQHRNCCLKHTFLLYGSIKIFKLPTFITPTALCGYH